MFKRALIATDLSESSEKFLSCKAGLRHLGVQEIIIGFCIRLHEVRGVRANIENILKPDLDCRREALEKQGYSTKAEILLGDPHIEVNRLAEEKNCSLVVVGSRVLGRAGEIFVGGVAGEILHYCRKPLLVARIPDEIKDPKTCPLASPGRLLFPTDFSENADHAFAVVLKLARESRKSVILIHVQDRSRIERHLKDRLEGFNAADRARMERMKERLAAEGVQDVRIELMYGLPTEELLNRTRQKDLSLIVMASHGRGFFSELFMGSVSHNIARQSPVPVLLIPALRARSEK